MATKGSLEDGKVNVKVKLSAMWASVTLCYLYCDYFELYVPGKVDGLIKTENLLSSPMKLLAAAVLLAIPAVMVFLSLVLKPAAGRLLNIITGLLFTLMMVFIATTYSERWYTFYLFFAILESIITALIVWQAWKWPRQTETGG